MRTFTKDELKEVLERHGKWARAEEGCERADLGDADLRDAYLRGADLRGAYLGGADLGGADLGDADLRGADLRGADLGGAYLRGADLGGADLRGADLRDAYLRGADLRGAYLGGADLGGADLRGADLRDAYLRGADLGGADLRGADLGGADLRGADLRGADLGDADLRGAKNVPFIPYACPDFGSFIGYKKCNSENGDVIVELEILSDARRCSATGRKCRCDKAKVLAIQTIDGTPAEAKEAVSTYNRDFKYRVGEIVEVKDFCEDRWEECAAGIHFFINRQEAVNY